MHPLYVQDFSTNITDLLLSLLDEKRLFQDQRLDIIKNVSYPGSKDALRQSTEKSTLAKNLKPAFNAILKVYPLS